MNESCWYWPRRRWLPRPASAYGPGSRRRRAIVPQVPALPFGRRGRQAQDRPGPERPRRPQVRHHRGLQLQRGQQEGRHHLGRGELQGIHRRTRWPRSPAPRWRSPASRTKTRSPTSGPISSSSRPTARSSNSLAITIVARAVTRGILALACRADAHVTLMRGAVTAVFRPQPNAAERVLDRGLRRRLPANLILDFDSDFHPAPSSRQRSRSTHGRTTRSESKKNISWSTPPPSRWRARCRRDSSRPPRRRPAARSWANSCNRRSRW